MSITLRGTLMADQPVTDLPRKAPGSLQYQAEAQRIPAEANYFVPFDQALDAPGTYQQEIFHWVLRWTFVAPPLMGLLFLAAYWSKPTWTALTLAAVLFLFTLIGGVCLWLTRRERLSLAARVYLSSVLVMVGLFLLVVPEVFSLPGVVVLFILLLLAMAIEPFTRALGWAAVMALLYLVTRWLRPLTGLPAVEFGAWGGPFLYVLPVFEIAIFVVLMRVVTLELIQARVQSKRTQRAWQQLAAIVETSDDAIVSRTLDGIILSWNRGAERLYGYSAAEMLDHSNALLVPPDRSDEWLQITQRLTRGERVEHLETVRLRKDGKRVHVSMTVSPIYNARGDLVAVSTIARDITERKRIEEQLRHLSTHDALTGLFNRAYFEAELDRLIQGRGFPVSVVLADVDALKWVNDSQGHGAGDQLLRSAAMVLQASFRAEDAVARLGGDEFGVLLPSTDQHVAEALVRRVRQNLELQDSRNEMGRFSLSLGTATADEGDHLAEALKRADERLYQDKSDHRRKYLRSMNREAISTSEQSANDGRG